MLQSVRVLNDFELSWIQRSSDTVCMVIENSFKLFASSGPF